MRSSFVSMRDIVPEGKVGIARTEHFTVSGADSTWTALRPGCFVPPGEYVRLYVGGSLMMSDTPMERRSNYEVVRRAHGHVLIAGLGLGMILVPILNKSDVTDVTVIEKYGDVRDLIGPHVATPKLQIIVADIYDWRPPKGSKFNVIYFDIWSGQSTDDLESMTKLHRAFRPFLDRSDEARWMDSWNRGELKCRKRREAREERWFRLPGRGEGSVISHP